MVWQKELIMSVRRVYNRLFRKRERACALALACVFCVILFTLRHIKSIPELQLDVKVEEKKTILQGKRKLWSVDTPLTMTNYSGNIVVVEEHHEVLQYWLQDSNLPQSGNILVHIDGHQDGALVPNAPFLPWFKRPKNTYELHSMMQENDMFISAAIMTGLISRIVYIWPIWDQGNHSRKYEATEFAIGWHVPDRKFSEKPKELCMCEMQDNNLQPEGMECLSAQRSEGRNDDGVPVNASNCHVLRRVHMEEVWDRGAWARLLRGGWINPTDNIILDIDEDFFGCEASDTRFNEVDLPWNTLLVLDQQVDTLFCVRNVEMERETDAFLSDVIKTVMATVDPRSTNERKLCKEKTLKQLENFRSMQRRPGKQRIVCRHGENRNRHNSNSIRELFFKIVDTLLDMTTDQLKLVKKVGFCFRSSPVTYIDESPDSMQNFGVCHGSTGPGNSHVTHHVPTSQEIAEQTDKLSVILSLLPQPKHVTVCRSFRDGYVPKELWPQIEKNILTSIKERFPDFKSVHYDPRLLGGPKGWFARDAINSQHQ